MVQVRRIFKDHHDAGSVASLLALWGFVDDHIFLTKAGALGVVYRLRGVDAECLDHTERRAVTLRIEQVLRQLDESFRLYQYLIKRPANFHTTGEGSRSVAGSDSPYSRENDATRPAGSRGRGVPQVADCERGDSHSAEMARSGETDGWSRTSRISAGRTPRSVISPPRRTGGQMRHPAPDLHPVVREAIERRADYFAGKAEGLFEVDLYLVILYEGWAGQGIPAPGAAGIFRAPAATLRQRLLPRQTTQRMEDELRLAAAHLHQKVSALMAQLEDSTSPALLPKADAFRFLRRLLNYAPHKVVGVDLKYDTHLDFYASDSEVECHRDHLLVDGYRVKALTMKEPPARTFAGILRDLCAIPCSFIACLEWQKIPATRIRRDIHARRRHFFNKRISLVNYVSSQTRPEDMLVDDSATAVVHELGQSLTEVEVNGNVFGACSLTMVLYDRDERRLDRSVAGAIKAFAGHDGALYEESYNLLNAWLAVVPGNASHNLRRLALLNTNAADLSLVFAPYTGERASPHLGGRECLAVLETEDQTPFFWCLHHQDVGHTLLQGATGSGKSFLCSFMVTHAQKYDPITVIFDLGGSYDGLVRSLGGSTWRMGLTGGEFSINPFCLEPTQENLHFLFSFVRVLIQSGGQHQLAMQDDRELYEAVDSLYALDPPQRRLFTLANVLPRHLSEHLYRWVQGGPYATLFDNVEDTLTLQRIQCFDFEGLERFPLVLEPLLFYVLHRMSAAVQDRAADSTLKLFLLDEAWRFARDRTVKRYITEALKTWRKRNASLILATQSTDDFADEQLLRTVIESCPTQLFLSNPGLHLDRARDLFDLNHTEATLIAALRPRQQALFKRPDRSKVINLAVDTESVRLYAGSARTVS